MASESECLNPSHFKVATVWWLWLCGPSHTKPHTHTTYLCVMRKSRAGRKPDPNQNSQNRSQRWNCRTEFTELLIGAKNAELCHSTMTVIPLNRHHVSLAPFLAVIFSMYADLGQWRDQLLAKCNGE